MKTWTRITGDGRRCGACGAPLVVGDPVAVYEFGRAKLFRCEACDGPAPPDLPTLRVLQDARPTREPIRIAGLLPLDWRPTAASLREREPGEDDA